MNAPQLRVSAEPESQGDSNYSAISSIGFTWLDRGDPYGPDEVNDGGRRRQQTGVTFSDGQNEVQRAHA